MTTLLVIEDDDNNLTLISRLLELEGFKVWVARTGEEGIDLALRVRPDAILLDIGLPDMPGTEVLHHLRDSEIGSDVPIIAVTSYAMSGDRERLLQLGCSGYIEKPIDPDNFGSQVKSTINGTS
ncbi:MAG: two-component system response regulator [gamma proteobacterium symbiont of Stewartia floridana]|nr:response regulator [Candidatus Thiodiazotropha taylori]RLW62357.1 MAG: two-component system response regulator [gamma proteobacterium symbiont of Stewartia floridana]RLW67520.1 MAG: two-component system response regulator [gamma proteobacterium symbiont of Stewartia floridana]RLW70599.1 MAG: two-component system response regulator [gamma proteobacterium symbiont of Stewartia floridana]